MNFTFIIFITSLSLFVFVKVIKLYKEEGSSLKNVPNKAKLLITGFVANVFDTLGVGSFAVIIALNNKWKLVDNKQLPGTLNSQGILVSMTQAILFIQVVKVDPYLLISFVGAACIGAFMSSFIVLKINKQTLNMLMAIGFFIISVLILICQFNLFPIGGEISSPSTFHYWVGVPMMIIIGMAPAIGMGMYVPIQVLMFLLGFSPLVAFPIMTAAGALAQTTTAYILMSNKEISVKPSLLMGVSGVIGVLVIVPFIPYFNIITLRWLLCAIVLYNMLSSWKLYRQSKSKHIEQKVEVL